MKKVFIVSSSFRKNGNSEILAKSFEKGALESGNEVTFLSLRDINLKFCVGCLTCQKKLRCHLNDDVEKYLDEISSSDVLVFATPIYYYEMSGQLKTFLDRLNPLFIKDNKFKEVYFLASAAEDETDAGDRAKAGLTGWIDCFEGVELKGYLLGKALKDVGEATNSVYPELAYKIGKSI